ncbi:hypothetical protein HYH03_004466 [Edaphochlamys debaryana]|uniref:Uncharacterized protein n=1 Tax=Edaphochlamys debaryana TaxID=47281 RepID=A0A835Y7K4_9CHLO|nr:hypothetical protein HYH03_004466 [Edaphochlamys debaryana]|eukprot:KAG2497730.1 hypothetical protein HYH03_004466 [Edaphochlamys debaryana]
MCARRQIRPLQLAAGGLAPARLPWPSSAGPRMSSPLVRAPRRLLLRQLVVAAARRNRGADVSILGEETEPYAYVSALYRGQVPQRPAGPDQQYAWVPYKGALYLPLWLGGGVNQWWRLRRVPVAPREEPPRRGTAPAAAAAALAALESAVRGAATGGMEGAAQSASASSPGGESEEEDTDLDLEVDGDRARKPPNRSLFMRGSEIPVRPRHPEDPDGPGGEAQPGPTASSGTDSGRQPSAWRLGRAAVEVDAPGQEETAGTTANGQAEDVAPAPRKRSLLARGGAIPSRPRSPDAPDVPLSDDAARGSWTLGRAAVQEAADPGKAEPVASPADSEPAEAAPPRSKWLVRGGAALPARPRQPPETEQGQDEAGSAAGAGPLQNSTWRLGRPAGEAGAEADPTPASPAPTPAAEPAQPRKWLVRGGAIPSRPRLPEQPGQGTAGTAADEPAPSSWRLGRAAVEAAEATAGGDPQPPVRRSLLSQGGAIPSRARRLEGDAGAEAAAPTERVSEAGARQSSWRLGRASVEGTGTPPGGSTQTSGPGAGPEAGPGPGLLPHQPLLVDKDGWEVESDSEGEDPEADAELEAERAAVVRTKPEPTVGQQKDTGQGRVEVRRVPPLPARASSASGPSGAQRSGRQARAGGASAPSPAPAPAPTPAPPLDPTPVAVPRWGRPGPQAPAPAGAAAAARTSGPACPDQDGWELEEDEEPGPALAAGPASGGGHGRGSAAPPPPPPSLATAGVRLLRLDPAEPPPAAPPRRVAARTKARGARLAGKAAQQPPKIRQLSIPSSPASPAASVPKPDAAATPAPGAGGMPAPEAARSTASAAGSSPAGALRLPEGFESSWAAWQGGQGADSSSSGAGSRRRPSYRTAASSPDAAAASGSGLEPRPPSGAGAHSNSSPTSPLPPPPPPPAEPAAGKAWGAAAAGVDDAGWEDEEGLEGASGGAGGWSGGGGLGALQGPHTRIPWAGPASPCARGPALSPRPWAAGSRRGASPAAASAPAPTSPGFGWRLPARARGPAKAAVAAAGARGYGAAGGAAVLAQGVGAALKGGGRAVQVWEWELAVSSYGPGCGHTERLASWTRVCALPGGDMDPRAALLAAELVLPTLPASPSPPPPPPAPSAPATPAATSAAAEAPSRAALEAALRRARLAAAAARAPSAAQKALLMRLALKGRFEALDSDVFAAVCPPETVPTVQAAAQEATESGALASGRSSHAGSKKGRGPGAAAATSLSESSMDDLAALPYGSMDASLASLDEDGGSSSSAAPPAVPSTAAGGAGAAGGLAPVGLLAHHLLALAQLEEGEENERDALEAEAAAARGLPPPVTRRQRRRIQSLMRRAAQGVDSDAGPWLRSVFRGAGVPDRKLWRLVSEMVGDDYNNGSGEYDMAGDVAYDVAYMSYEYGEGPGGGMGPAAQGGGSAGSKGKGGEGPFEGLLGLLSREGAELVSSRLREAAARAPAQEWGGGSA